MNGIIKNAATKLTMEKSYNFKANGVVQFLVGSYSISSFLKPQRK
jgi:hypothetical protein